MNFSTLFDSGYLLDPAPDAFAFQNATIILLIFAIAIFMLLMKLLKKKRNMVKLTVDQRLVFRKYIKLALIGSVILLVLVVIRTQGVAYLSMRLIALLVGLGIVISLGYGLLKIVLLKPSKESKKQVQDSNFMDYMPKKKKR